MNRTLLLIYIALSLISCENNGIKDKKHVIENKFEKESSENSIKNVQKSSSTEPLLQNETNVIEGFEFSTKNLDVVTFKNGETIMQTNSSEEWLLACRKNIPAYFAKKLTNGQVSIYYNWHVIKDRRGIAPEGWHIPNSNELTQFINALGYEIAGDKMKSSNGWKEWNDDLHCSNCKNILWIKPSERGKHSGPCGKIKRDGNGTNSSKFNGQPNGYIYWGNNILSLGSLACYWVLDTEPTSLHLSNQNEKAEFHIDGYKEIGYNIRCFKDNEPTLNGGDNKLKYDMEKDQNGNEFKLIQIENQFWMAQNLEVDKFRNGDPIKHAKTVEEWIKAGNNREPAWCYYENKPDNGLKYGKLYNSYALTDKRGLAPFGWHIPSDDEWSNMVVFLGGFSGNTGKNMKLNNGWLNQGNGTNISGFSGLPGGARDNDGVFYNGDEVGSWWSTTKDWYYGARIYELSSYLDRIKAQKYLNNSYGFSVRCVKD